MISSASGLIFTNKGPYSARIDTYKAIAHYIQACSYDTHYQKRLLTLRFVKVVWPVLGSDLLTGSAQCQTPW